jgi:hypothetical protein
MRPFGNQPRADEIEALIEGEDIDLLQRPDVPDEEKVEIDQQLEAWREVDVEEAIGDEPLPPQ